HLRLSRILFLSSIYYHLSRNSRDLHSFPTRRSSDLCIIPYSNGPAQTYWKSSVVTRDESWNETIRIRLAEEDVPLVHIYITVSRDRKSTRLNSSHVKISYAVFCLKKKII